MTPTETALAAIWAEVLRQEALGPDADFFALGGNSLMAVRMGGLVKERLGVEAPVSQLFIKRTLTAFAGAIDEVQADAPADEEQGVI